MAEATEDELERVAGITGTLETSGGARLVERLEGEDDRTFADEDVGIGDVVASVEAGEFP